MKLMSVTGFVQRSGGKIRSTIVDIRIFWSGGAVGAGQALVAATQQPANLLKNKIISNHVLAF